MIKWFFTPRINLFDLCAMGLVWFLINQDRSVAAFILMVIAVVISTIVERIYMEKDCG